MDKSQSLRSLFLNAESKCKSLSAMSSSTTKVYQEALVEAIAMYSKCLHLVDMLSLFSPNETLDDVSTANLQYFTIHHQYAHLFLQVVDADRISLLLNARTEFENYLQLVNNYNILSPEDSRTYVRYQDDPTTFSTASVTDATARRATKIARFKKEKELKMKLVQLHQSSGLHQTDDTSMRELQLTKISLCTHDTFQALESIAQEMDLLSSSAAAPDNNAKAFDPRERNTSSESYNERLDKQSATLTNFTGPILSQSGKPLRPFTLLETRQRLRNEVFRPDHNLPTMTIDEYLDEEKRRGGIIEGGGPKSGIRPEPEEDNFEKVDQDTLKARAWDDFKDDNPKGSGNTMNMG